MDSQLAESQVVGVSRSRVHGFHKEPLSDIALLQGFGVQGDAHGGEYVQHRSRVAKDPSQVNLRQVHLIHSELFVELAAIGYVVGPGQLGENITTQGIDLLGLGAGTLLEIGGDAVVEVTGLRNPCGQLNKFQPGLMDAVLARTPTGEVIRKAGIMAIVLADGVVAPGDSIKVGSSPNPHTPLVVV